MAVPQDKMTHFNEKKVSVQQAPKSINRRKNRATKSTKVGKATSTYCLYVEFSAAFAIARESMCYYSNTRFSDDYELEALKRRVLHGSCRGKYKLAKLYHQRTGQCLSVWVPGQVEMSYESYVAFRSENTPYTKSLLTALVIYKRDFKAQRQLQPEQFPSYIYSVDCDPITREKDFDIALHSLILQLTEGKFKGTYYKVIIYHGEEKRELARMSVQGRVTCVDEDFKKKIYNSSRFKLPELGIYVKL
jgi:hypothetical protein